MTKLNDKIYERNWIIFMGKKAGHSTFRINLCSCSRKKHEIGACFNQRRLIYSTIAKYGLSNQMTKLSVFFCHYS